MQAYTQMAETMEMLLKASQRKLVDYTPTINLFFGKKKTNPTSSSTSKGFWVGFFFLPTDKFAKIIIAT